MMELKPKPVAQKTFLALTVVIAIMTGWTSYASRGVVKDRRITLEESRQLVSLSNKEDQIKLPINSEVVAQLNHFLGTPEGREYFKAALKRKESYSVALDEAVKEFGTPESLNAIPIVESGYRNISSGHSSKAAGLWMFIPSTARRFGMEVSSSRDERFKVFKETRAAHRYLKSNKERFNDWMLGIFAYNVGESAVERGIKKFGTRDVWELGKHIHGDKNYMARVVAAMIIMKNQSLLED